MMGERKGIRLKYRRFEELPVWNAAIELAVGVFELSATGCFQGYAGLAEPDRAGGGLDLEQHRRGLRAGRPARSCSTFLYIARGSAGEVRSMLCLIERIPASSTIGGPRSLDLKSSAANITRQLECLARLAQEQRDQGHLATRRRRPGRRPRPSGGATPSSKNSDGSRKKPGPETEPDRLRPTSDPTDLITRSIHEPSTILPIHGHRPPGPSR